MTVDPLEATVIILDDDGKSLRMAFDMILTIHLCPYPNMYTELVFEFIQERDTVNEDVGSVVLNLHFVFGIIEAYNISVVVSTANGSAVGRL